MPSKRKEKKKRKEKEMFLPRNKRRGGGGGGPRLRKGRKILDMTGSWSLQGEKGRKKKKK